MGNREKNSPVHRSKEHQFSVPLFGKACPESFGFAQDKLSRREGKGKFLDGMRWKLCGEFLR
jgi:hypothetical protein